MKEQEREENNVKRNGASRHRDVNLSLQLAKRRNKRKAASRWRRQPFSAMRRKRPP